MGIGIYIDPPSRSLLADRFFERTVLIVGRLPGIIKNTFGAKSSRPYGHRMPAPNGSDIICMYRSVILRNYRPFLTGLSGSKRFMVTESPVVDPRMFSGLKTCKTLLKRIFLVRRTKN